MDVMQVCRRFTTFQQLNSHVKTGLVVGDEISKFTQSLKYKIMSDWDPVYFCLLQIGKSIMALH